ncbi:TetR/AcrR family transcriptional regulator [Amycolatopsis sp. FBCC-B4732]|uniref:TetR/AcrR family transcriptional regulator n=1 Tax=Amycolatopsis sp. FBCC-B4732 TaxID=3079339 RepID=UPI001FF505C9|nr:TetR/AcrR family transcriptional regulator [Amycolatopsis sp. FBCC-B4732]UOX90999.1 TetR/AcrR family transcriptional regulator [Amycolatopsis sp. FBCC-B4732]
MAGKRDLILRAAVAVIARSGVRGLRVEEVAAEAGASTGLIYYHFKDRAGLLSATLDHVNDRAERYTTRALPDTGDARVLLEQSLLLELQDVDEVRENSLAWGELRASAVFEPGLRDRLTGATGTWVAEIAELVAAAAPAAPADDVAERLTALVEGLSERWLSGTLPLARARDLLSGAITAELGS